MEMQFLVNDILESTVACVFVVLCQRLTQKQY